MQLLMQERGPGPGGLVILEEEGGLGGARPNILV